jgi:hypothetical protein
MRVFVHDVSNMYQEQGQNPQQYQEQMLQQSQETHLLLQE